MSGPALPEETIPATNTVYPSIAGPTWVMRLKRLYESVSGARNRSFVQYRPSKRFRLDFNGRDTVYAPSVQIFWNQDCESPIHHMGHSSCLLIST